jgi:hypothetical protein
MRSGAMLADCPRHLYGHTAGDGSFRVAGSFAPSQAKSRLEPE